MAGIERTTTTVEVEDHHWGQQFTGTREALVEHGLVDPTQFPGDPGNNKVSLTYQEEARGVRRVSRGRGVSVRRVSRNRFVVWREYPNDQAKREGEARIAEAERQQNIADHRARAKLPPLARNYAIALHALLSRRYPGIEIADVSISPLGDGVQQTVTFRAPNDRLMDAGLLTEKMIAARGWGELTPIGDGYVHHEYTDHASLTIWTGTWPREGRKTAVHDAIRELKRFMLPKRRGRKD